MILSQPYVDPVELADHSGWELKPEGFCRGPVCVPLRQAASEPLPAELVAEHLGMPLVADPAAGVWALGPEAGRTLRSGSVADFTLPDWRGEDFRLSSLRGQKVLILAWAPW